MAYIFIFIIISIFFLIKIRKVVPNNKVHIIEKENKSIIYWKGYKWWNSYFSWPAYIPFIWWIKTKILPLSVFNLKIKSYKTYDKTRVPFLIDIIWFFKISDPIANSQNIESIKDLEIKLNDIFKLSIIKVFEEKNIIEIFEKIKKVDKEILDTLNKEIKSWWIEVKSIKILDIMDIEDWKSDLIKKISKTNTAKNLKKEIKKELEKLEAVKVRDAIKNEYKYLNEIDKLREKIKDLNSHIEKLKEKLNIYGKKSDNIKKWDILFDTK